MKLNRTQEERRGKENEPECQVKLKRATTKKRKRYIKKK